MLNRCERPILFQPMVCVQVSYLHLEVRAISGSRVLAIRVFLVTSGGAIARLIVQQLSERRSSCIEALTWSSKVAAGVTVS